jgi:hypothetical protein
MRNEIVINHQMLRAAQNKAVISYFLRQKNRPHTGGQRRFPIIRTSRLLFSYERHCSVYSLVGMNTQCSVYSVVCSKVNLTSNKLFW